MNILSKNCKYRNSAQTVSNLSNKTLQKNLINRRNKYLRRKYAKKK